MMLRLCIFILGLPFCILGQGIQSSLGVYQSTHHLEKVYISTNKPYYIPGDTIWAKAHLVDAKTHLFFKSQALLAVQLLNANEELVYALTLKIKKGVASFDIPIPLNWKAGKYILRSYSEYQRNFEEEFLFHREITLLDKNTQAKPNPEEDSLQVFFYPEGGYMVNGMSNRVVFETNLARGSTTDVRASIKDRDGITVAQAFISEDNLGEFRITPKLDQDYTFQLSFEDDHKILTLPTILDEGFVMQVNGTDKDHIFLSISSIPGNLLKGSNLIGHVRGDIFLDIKLRMKANQVIRLDREDIPVGIVHFTLFDDTDMPRCERLCFNIGSGLTVKTHCNLMDEYSLEEEVALQIQTMEGNELVESTLSVSIYNRDLYDPESIDLNIVNYLLLQSDIKLNSSNLLNLFDGHRIMNPYLLDLHLMTKAWRRFLWNDVKQNNVPIISHRVQENFSIKGVVIDSNKEEPIKAKVTLIALGVDIISAEQVTDDYGMFSFGGLGMADTTDIILQAYRIQDEENKKKQDSKNIKIELLSSFPALGEKIDLDTSFQWTSRLEPLSLTQQFLVREDARLDSLIDAAFAVDIEEVVIEDSRYYRLQQMRQELKELYKRRGWRFSNIGDIHFVPDNPGAKEAYDVSNLLTTLMPGLVASGGGATKRGVKRRIPKTNRDLLNFDFEIKYKNVPVLVDFKYIGFELEDIDPQKIFAITSTPYGYNLITYDPTDIKRSEQKDHILNFTHPGYYQAREFRNRSIESTAKISSSEIESDLYWNPNVRIRSKGEVLNFFTGYRPGNYVAIMEGITLDGKPFINRYEFKLSE